MRKGDPCWVQHWAPEQAATLFRGTYLGAQKHGAALVRWEEGPLAGREARVTSGQVKPRREDDR